MTIVVFPFCVFVIALINKHRITTTPVRAGEACAGGILICVELFLRNFERDGQNFLFEESDFAGEAEDVDPGIERFNLKRSDICS